MSIPPESTLVLPPFVDRIASLAECLCEYLTLSGSGPTCWCGVYAGVAASWEHCEECSEGKCGMGWVRVAQVFPSDTFPTATLDQRCAKPLAVPVEVGVVRCIPVLPDGEMISPKTMTEVWLDQMADMWAGYQAIKCCPAAGEYAVESWTPIGPEGTCIGGYWTVYLDAG